jgi:ribonuclease P protein component
MPIRPDPTTPATTQSGRLTRRAEFLRVAAKGRKAPMPGLVLQALPRADDGPARLGFTVTKKVGNAVIRNRTRRRLKEAARLNLREAPLAGVDLVLIGRDGTRTRDFLALRDDLRRALAKAGVAAPSEAGGTQAGAAPVSAPDAGGRKTGEKKIGGSKPREGAAGTPILRRRAPAAATP